MAVIIGMVIVAALVLRLFSLLLEWAIFKRVMDDPIAGKVISLLAAWALTSLIIASGAIIFRGGALLLIGAAALLLLPFAIRSGLAARRRVLAGGGTQAHLKETFS
ncbi:MAG: hypothetical protein JWR80_6499 [Bradyrhizobium sp.]|nr:hypothetical protein [Bradyrhizobium sp.]